MRETGPHSWDVAFTVTNTGDRHGQEVAQLYVAFDAERPTRPRHGLRAFAKVGLAPGASERVRLALGPRDLAQWSVTRGGWRIDPGAFTVEVGASSRDIRLRAELSTPGDGHVGELSEMSTLGEWLAHPVGGRMLKERLRSVPGLSDLDRGESPLVGLALGIPLIKFRTFGIGLTAEVVTALVAATRNAL
ncbi:fibronectin type III-like domain-contianing protein [Nonomuraea sp. NPDC052265]|uniref:fibronectin type III-like domain-contianing protein n=1 Tax=Nonomuraea sp. NPDC052265 TaxID=3364374 RepID=UPI0037CA2733